MRRIVAAVFVIAVGLGAPPVASAQWYFGTFTGANYTHDADVVVHQPSLNRRLTFESVPFKGEPLKSPQYYGARLGFQPKGWRLAIEGEFLHIKVIALTDREVRVTGEAGDVTIDVVQPMNAIVQSFDMSHGLNFWFTNLVWRTPLGRATAEPRVTLVLRTGAGPVVAGVDTRVDGTQVNHYEYASLGAQGAAGVEIQVASGFWVTGEYKFTFARPRIDVASGTGQTTALTHHVAGGFAIGFAP